MDINVNLEKRIDWIKARVELDEITERYIMFQMKEAVIETIKKVNDKVSSPNTPMISFELNREDLTKLKANYSIDEITIYDFKHNSITRDEINKAELITFKDGDKTKVLKSRY